MSNMKKILLKILQALETSIKNYLEAKFDLFIFGYRLFKIQDQSIILQSLLRHRS